MIPKSGGIAVTLVHVFNPKDDVTYTENQPFSPIRNVFSATGIVQRFESYDCGMRWDACVV